MFVFTGLPGAGKSTLARALAAKSGAAILSTDDYRRRDGIECVNKSYYDEMFDMLRTNIQASVSSIADATFFSQELRRKALKVCSGNECAATLVVFNAPVDVCRQRALQRRDRIEGIATPEEFAALTSIYEPVSAIEMAAWPNSVRVFTASRTWLKDCQALLET